MSRIPALSVALCVFVIACAAYPRLDITSTKQFSDGSYLVAVKKTNISQSMETNLTANSRARELAVTNICPIGGSAVRVDPEGTPLENPELVGAAVETLLSNCLKCAEGLTVTSYFRVRCNEGAS